MGDLEERTEGFDSRAFVIGVGDYHFDILGTKETENEKESLLCSVHCGLFPLPLKTECAALSFVNYPYRSQWHFHGWKFKKFKFWRIFVIVFFLDKNVIVILLLVQKLINLIYDLWIMIWYHLYLSSFHQKKIYIYHQRL